MMENASHVACEVGRMYLVPCMHTSLSGSFLPEWVPVIGPRHTDEEHLKFPHEHYHIDWRFVSDATYQSALGEVSGVVHGTVLTNTHGKHRVEGCAVLKRRMCKRLMPDHPARPRENWVALELAQRSTCNRLKPGNICPHRGIDLTPFAKPDGTAICPGHGLKWNLRTGELLSHHEAAK
jgi:hypothetical protein